jgi:hypothetical protein
MVTPDVREQERSGKRATHSPGIVPEVEFPQRFDRRFGCVGPVPAPPNGNRICVAHSVDPACTLLSAATARPIFMLDGDRNVTRHSIGF